MPRIEFDEVSKRYTEDAIAVDDLSLTVEDGMFLCILGPRRHVEQQLGLGAMGLRRKQAHHVV